MTNKLSVILLISISYLHSYGQTAKPTQDTTIVIKDCMEISTYYVDHNKHTSTKFLDCFWESDVDTIIVIKDCEQHMTLTKGEHELIYTKILPCFWDDAKISSDTVLKPSYNDKWRIYINTTLNKKGRTKNISSSTGIFATEAYQGGLDTINKKSYPSSHPVFKQYTRSQKNKDIPFSIRDTTINIKFMLENVNNLRNAGCKCGDKNMGRTFPLKWNNDLESVAFLYAKEMYLREFFSHSSPEGHGHGERLTAYGIATLWGENIADGQMNGVEAFKSWLTSPGHCENMMMGRYKCMGVAKYMNKYCMILGTTVRKIDK